MICKKEMFDTLSNYQLFKEDLYHGVRSSLCAVNSVATTCLFCSCT
jgi:hypothetical protein